MNATEIIFTILVAGAVGFYIGRVQGYEQGEKDTKKRLESWAYRTEHIEEDYLGEESEVLRRLGSYRQETGTTKKMVYTPRGKGLRQRFRKNLSYGIKGTQENVSEKYRTARDSFSRAVQKIDEWLEEMR